MPRPPRAFGQKESPEIKALILDGLRLSMSISKAAERAGVSRATAFKWRSEDPAFATAWVDAVEDGVDRLEDEAIRRAHDGTTRPVFFKDTQVGEIREYSDTLMTLVLRGKRPKVYKERLEHTGADGGPIETRSLTKEEALAKLKELGLPTRIFNK
jgi:hypothetical protein